MTERVAATPGIYPLPDWAKETLSELKGHQKGDLLTGNESGEIAETYEAVRNEHVDDQLAAGLDRVVDGQSRWDDILAHPLTVHDAVETGGIVRYYDNNNFYRDPRVTGELDFSGDVAAEIEATAAVAGDTPVAARTQQTRSARSQPPPTPTSSSTLTGVRLMRSCMHTSLMRLTRMRSVSTSSRATAMTPCTTFRNTARQTPSPSDSSTGKTRSSRIQRR